jgi:hypothetical protein
MALRSLPFIGLLLIASASLIHSQSNSVTKPQLPADSAWVLKGQVVDEAGPVSGATVQALGPGEIDLSVLTDKSGHYELAGTKVGKYHILAWREDYEGSGDWRKARTLGFAAGAEVTRADFVIHKAASISGRILDIDRNPVKGAVVVLDVELFEERLHHLETRASTTSEASGNYRLDGIGAGMYFLSVAPPLRDNAAQRKREREPKRVPVVTYYPNSASFDNAMTLYVRRAEQKEAVDLTVSEAVTFCVTGKPKVERGATMAQSPRLAVAPLVGSSWGGWVGAGDAKLNEDFEVCGLPPGSYALSLVAAKDRLEGFVSQEFTVANRDVSLGELSLRRPLQLRGKVTIADGPADGLLPAGVRVQVRTLSRPSPFAGEGTGGHLSSQGEFLIDNVFADDYHLRVLSLPRGFYVKSVTQEGRDVMRGAIRPGHDLAIALASDGPVVNVETVDSEERPVGDAEVILIPRDQGPGAIARAHANEHGRAQFESGIAPGEYSIVALTGLVEGQDQNPGFLRDQLTRASTLVLDKKENKIVRLTVRATQLQ